MPKVRAKFKCESVNHFAGSKEAKLSAVYSNSGENADFTKYTPSGSLSIHISDESAASVFFEPGAEYYLDFEKVGLAH